MVKLLHPKYGLCLIFLIFFCVIKKTENFQLRDLSVGEADGGVGLKPTPAAKSKFSFRKLETKKVINFDDNDEDESDLDFKFEKVRNPTFEVKKRNLRPSVLSREKNK